MQVVEVLLVIKEEMQATEELEVAEMLEILFQVV
jgi:hypothetical protein